MSAASEVRALRIRIGQLRAKVRKQERGSPAQIKLMRDVQRLEATLYRIQESRMIKLMHGDCFDLLTKIEDASIDMILTDPPYGMDLTPQRETGKFHGVKIQNDATLEWVDGFFEQCYRVTKKNTASMFFCNHHCVSEFIAGAKKAGFEIKNMLVWDKKQFGMGGNWRPCHELILICTKGRFVTKSNSLKTIIEFSRMHHSRAVHPTEKPTDLLRHLIEQPDYDPQVIFDPFMGSGSTGDAAVSLGRSFIGIGKSLEYYPAAEKRIFDVFISQYA